MTQHFGSCRRLIGDSLSQHIYTFRMGHGVQDREQGSLVDLVLAVLMNTSWAESARGATNGEREHTPPGYIRRHLGGASLSGSASQVGCLLAAGTRHSTSHRKSFDWFIVPDFQAQSKTNHAYHWFPKTHGVVL